MRRTDFHHPLDSFPKVPGYCNSVQSESGSMSIHPDKQNSQSGKWRALQPELWPQAWSWPREWCQPQEQPPRALPSRISRKYTARQNTRPRPQLPKPEHRLPCSTSPSAPAFRPKQKQNREPADSDDGKIRNSVDPILRSYRSRASRRSPSARDRTLDLLKK